MIVFNSVNDMQDFLFRYPKSREILAVVSKISGSTNYYIRGRLWFSQRDYGNKGSRETLYRRGFSPVATYRSDNYFACYNIKGDDRVVISFHGESYHMAKHGVKYRSYNNGGIHGLSIEIDKNQKHRFSFYLYDVKCPWFLYTEQTL